MPWQLTYSRGEFETAAGHYLSSDPVKHTIWLTVLEALRQRGDDVFGDETPFFGWHEPAEGGTDGAFLRTPPYPVGVAELPSGSAPELIDVLLGERKPDAVNLPHSATDEFSAAWTARTGGSTAPTLRSRQFRLAELVPQAPFPEGAARIADESDFDLLVAWSGDFHNETGALGGEDQRRTVSDRLSHGGLSLWEIEGRPVSLGGVTRTVAGVARVGPIYTPPEHRQRGYGGAITSAVTRQALAGGATDVVLYTDLANPTSNALYTRLGYLPLTDRTVLALR